MDTDTEEEESNKVILVPHALGLMEEFKQVSQRYSCRRCSRVVQSHNRISCPRSHLSVFL